VYGKVLERVTEREKQLTADPVEQQVRDIFKQRAEAAGAKLEDLQASHDNDKAALARKLEDLKAGGAPEAEILAAQKALDDFPKTLDAYRAKLTADKAAATAKSAPPKPHATPSPARMSTRATWRGATSWRWCSV